MLAALNRPIVTDYVPVARPPWLLLAVLVGLFAFGLPRELLPTAFAAATVVALAGCLVNWLWVKCHPGTPDGAGPRTDSE